MDGIMNVLSNDVFIFCGVDDCQLDRKKCEPGNLNQDIMCMPS